MCKNCASTGLDSFSLKPPICQNLLYILLYMSRPPFPTSFKKYSSICKGG